jgi:hypothetical protein
MRSSSGSPCCISVSAAATLPDSRANWALSSVGRAASMVLALPPALGVYWDSRASASAACEHSRMWKTM